MRAVQRADGFCQACFTGQYPISVDLSNVKTGFERGQKYECSGGWFGGT